MTNNGLCMWMIVEYSSYINVMGPSTCVYVLGTHRIPHLCPRFLLSYGLAISDFHSAVVVVRAS